MLRLFEKCSRFYPNLWIAYRILLTIPVSVASTERSFLKLKLIKYYLRSTMLQERWSGLDYFIFNYKRELLRNIDFESLVNEFVEKKRRKLCFKIIIQCLSDWFNKTFFNE